MKTTITFLGSALFSVSLIYSPWLAAQQCNPNGHPSTPSQRFADHGDGTITDQESGLMWKKCLEGQQGSQCFGKPQLYSWNLANQQATTNQQEHFAGFSEWRLPTLAELKSIVETQCTHPAVNLNIFPATPSAGLWSSENDDTNNAWSLDFSKGNAFSVVKAGGKYVRLVRSI